MASRRLDDRLNLRLSRSERDQLSDVALREERTLSQQVRLAVRWFLATQDVALKDTTTPSEVAK